MHLFSMSIIIGVYREDQVAQKREELKNKASFCASYTG
jgi:hypothetical protein